jgi:RNA 2',3'-cyclic 3'-phosphodiesterase
MENQGLKVEDGEASAEAWRLFVAISLPEAVKDEIEKAQKELRGALRGNFIRWTKRDQFHLTLKFLGNVAVSRVAQLTEVLRGVGGQFSALRLRAERIGFFPDARFPRVAWVGVRDDRGILPRLQQEIEFKVKDFAAEKENGPAGRRRSQEGFTGHVTLARIQGIRRAQAEMLSKLALGMAGRFFGEWQADEVELIRSELSSGGSRYTTVATVSLSGTS